MLLIDALIYAFRSNAILYPEQQAAIVFAIESVEAQRGDDESEAVSAMFLQTIESLGFHRKTHLYKTLEEFLASPEYYRQHFPGFFCIPKAGQPTPQLMTDLKVIFLLEPLLSMTMKNQFEQDFWDFKRNHLERYTAVNKKEATPQLRMGVYAHTSQSNEASLERFENHFSHLCNHTNAKVREAYEKFPLKLAMKILKRSYPESTKTELEP